jgi:GTPase KRas
MLEVLDTAGQEEYTALRDQWIRDGEGFVLVYSISSRSSFARIQRFHNQIRRVKEKLQLEESQIYPGSPLSASSTGSGPPAPIMLVGNKCDRVTEREVSTREGYALARELSCDFVETSAKNCINVEKAFYDVVRQLRLQRPQVITARHKKPREDIRNKPSRGSNVKTAKPGGSSNSSDSYRSSASKKKDTKCIVL